MKLLSNDLEKTFSLNQHVLNTLVIEDNTFFREFISKIVHFVENDSNELEIMDEDEEISPTKCEIIVDIFRANPNNTKILTKLYSNLISDLSSDERYQDSINFESQLYSFMDKIAFDCDYHLTYGDIDYKSIFKALNLSIDTDIKGLMSNFVSYLDLSYKLLGKKIYFAVNLNTFFSQKDMGVLNDYLRYNNIVLVCLDNSLKRTLFEDENIRIIDQDLSEI
ncbi:MAG: type II-A CRISPR-associated protein Csn2 [Lactobacillus iners]|nr:type II-A CRISPR-associated protein Csn2 [Lactobacillus iners]